MDQGTVTKLYVVLHGEMLVFEDPADATNLTILIPDVPGHACLAGPWLGEQRIERGEKLQLSGITPGTSSISKQPDGYMIITGVQNYNAALPYCRIYLPRPHAIKPGLTFRRQPGDQLPKLLGPRGSAQLLPNSLVVLHPVLEYDLSPTDNPTFSRSAAPKPKEIGFRTTSGQETGTSVATVHIFSEEDRPLHAAHETDAVKLALSMVGLDIDLGSNPTRDEVQPPPPDGLHWTETQLSLFARAVFLSDPDSWSGSTFSWPTQDSSNVLSRHKLGILCGEIGSCTLVGVTLT